ncbi:polysaccharide deacetylase family protein [Nocardioides caeni]|uniref:polysaccharide deacetylase family protein n=1 Tax=Nocardioides caeni TaxID=574700 RepID=UPI0013051026|nr:polysaccharide deacetylase family protein [Nocardioides caeni]
MFASLLRRLGRHPARVAVGVTVLLSLLLAGLAPLPSRPGPHPLVPQGDAIRLASAKPHRPTPRSPRRCKGQIALTFDDGPSAAATSDLLDLLIDKHVPATFFVVGQRVEGNGALLRRMERAGFFIANHSWAHDQLTARPNRQVVRSLRSTDRALRRVGVHPTRLMRPPYGAINPRVRAAIRRAGFLPVLWTIDSQDWASGTTDQIANRILGSLRRGGNIVLQHDGVNRSPLSVRAVAKVVRVARQRGYCFAALDERGRPGFPRPHVAVSARGGVEGQHATVRLRLDASAGRRTSVVLATRSGTATVGPDLPALRRRVSIPAGSREVVVRIPLRSDDATEGREQASVVIGLGDGLRYGRRTDTFGIIDAEQATVRPVVATRSPGWILGFRFWG